MTTKRINSSFVTHLATALAAGRSPVLVGAANELGLLRGCALPIPELVARIGSWTFDIVIRLNAIDPPAVVHGGENFARAGGAAGLPSDLVVTGLPAADESDTPRDEGPPAGGRRARIDALRQPTPGTVEPITAMRALLAQTEASVLVIIEQADILLQDPSVHDVADRHRVAGLQLGIRDAADVARLRNAVVLITGELSSVPAVLRIGSDDLIPIEIALPTRSERRAVVQQLVPEGHGAGQLDDLAVEAAVEQLTDLTDGESLRSIADLLNFSARGRVTVADPRDLVERFRRGPRQDYWGHIVDRLPQISDFLRSRVFGQDHAIDRLVEALAAAALQISYRSHGNGLEGQPRGVLTFVGPTGVGKTELAKALAEALFGDPEAYLRMDMATMDQAHDASRITGAPPGYVGYEQGGELTNAVLRRAAMVILCDEIEKAHPAVFDRLLSVIDDGRVTDAQGRVAYFTECIIIATSNAGATELMAEVEARGEDVTVGDAERIARHALRQILVGHQRPEVFGRLAAGVIGFDFLRPAMVDRIADKLIADLTVGSGPRIDFDPETTRSHLRKRLDEPGARSLGGRMVRNEFDSLVKRLSSWIVLEGHHGAEVVRVEVHDSRMYASVDGSAPQLVA